MLHGLAELHKNIFYSGEEGTVLVIHVGKALGRPTVTSRAMHLTLPTISPMVDPPDYPTCSEPPAPFRRGDIRKQSVNYSAYLTIQAPPRDLITATCFTASGFPTQICAIITYLSWVMLHQLRPYIIEFSR